MSLTQISTAGVKDDAVTSGKIPANAVGASELADNAVDTAAIVDAAVTTAKIADAQITTDKINDTAVTNAKLATGAVTTVKITDDQITTSKINDTAVTTAKLDTGAVTTAKITDAQITTAKIADDAVTNAKLASNCITNSEIAGNSIDGDKIANTSITGVKLVNGAINEARISNGSVTTDKIGDQAVTLAKLPHGTSSNDGKFLRANNGADPTFESVNTRPGRNKIINGEFQVNQRNHSGSAGHNTYTLDRWKYGRSANTEFSQTQSTDTPDGFTNSVKMDCIGANGSTGAGDYAYWRYHIEGQHLQDLKKGTSAAQPFTLSFYFKSDITGTFAISIMDNNSRMCNANYTVSNTNWNRYEITIPADTTGTIANNNAEGLEVRFYIIAGTNHTSGSAVHTWGAYSASSIATGHNANIVSTDHNLYLTGVQLELGSVATPFEHKSYTDYLRECERYYIKDSYGGIRSPIHGNGARIPLHVLPQAMRTTPSASASTFTEFSAGSSRSISAFYLGGNKAGGYAQLTASPGNGVYVYVTFDAEL